MDGLDGKVGDVGASGTNRLEAVAVPSQMVDRLHMYTYCGRMPRGPRLDFTGAIHHVIVRGIERRRIFRSQADRELFLDRLAEWVLASHAGLYAWALMPNHAHLLLRTGQLPLSRLMQAWLSAYSTVFNRRHHRSGHLFQNRFKSTLIEEEPYLRQLLAYIHLNPVRSRLPVTLDSLDLYPWAGHAVVLGNRIYPAQDSDFVLSLFGQSAEEARRAYRTFVREYARGGQADDLDGGGLRRSLRGWKHRERVSSGRERWAHDERVLGSSEFVHTLLRDGDEPAVAPSKPAAVIQPLVDAVCERFRVSPGELGSRSLRPCVLDARATLSYAAVMHHGLSFTEVARQVGLSRRSIRRAIQRAQLTGLTEAIPLPGRTSHTQPR
jgi:putative transposase